VVGLDVCTAENTDLFYSYRAEGVTGRHGAIAAIR
jgi:copper oxidase (laccase) domain-containing protein